MITTKKFFCLCFLSLAFNAHAFDIEKCMKITLILKGDVLEQEILTYSNLSNKYSIALAKKKSRSPPTEIQGKS